MINSGQFKKGHIGSNRGQHLSEEYRRNISEALKGRHLTEQTIRKMRDSKRGKPSGRKGIPCSEECKQKLSETMIRRGVSKGERNPMFGRRLIASEETKRKISESNKGIPKSDEWKKLMSERRRRLWLNLEWRKRTTEAMKGKLKGKVPWMKGRHHTEEAKQKLRENHNGLFKGEKSPVWKGGITPERQALYTRQNWRDISRVVWRRDERECQLCHNRYSATGQRFEIHHIIPFENKGARLDLSNLILLCNRCHHLVHSRNFAVDFALGEEGRLQSG